MKKTNDPVPSGGRRALFQLWQARAQAAPPPSPVSTPRRTTPRSVIDDVLRTPYLDYQKEPQVRQKIVKFATQFPMLPQTEQSHYIQQLVPIVTEIGSNALQTTCIIPFLVNLGLAKKPPVKQVIGNAFLGNIVNTVLVHDNYYCYGGFARCFICNSFNHDAKDLWEQVILPNLVMEICKSSIAQICGSNDLFDYKAQILGNFGRNQAAMNSSLRAWGTAISFAYLHPSVQSVGEKNLNKVLVQVFTPIFRAFPSGKEVVAVHRRTALAIYNHLLFNNSQVQIVMTAIYQALFFLEPFGNNGVIYERIISLFSYGIVGILFDMFACLPDQNRYKILIRTLAEFIKSLRTQGQAADGLADERFNKLKHLSSLGNTVLEEVIGKARQVVQAMLPQINMSPAYQEEMNMWYLPENDQITRGLFAQHTSPVRINLVEEPTVQLITINIMIIRRFLEQCPLQGLLKSE